MWYVNNFITEKIILEIIGITDRNFTCTVFILQNIPRQWRRCNKYYVNLQFIIKTRKLYTLTNEPLPT